MVLILVLVFMILVYLVKKSSNSEVIKENCKSPNDKANVINARKVYNNTITSKVLLIASFVVLVFVILLKFTPLEYVIRDYISSDIEEQKDFSYLIFLAPAYIFVSRLIINEVKLGDFLYKFFKVKEPELEENPLKMIVDKAFRKPVKKDPENTESEEAIPEVKEEPKAEENKPVEEKKEEPPKEELPKETTEEKPKEELPKETTEEKPKEEIELPEKK
jgi:hypothetical protein